MTLSISNLLYCHYYSNNLGCNQTNLSVVAKTNYFVWVVFFLVGWIAQYRSVEKSLLANNLIVIPRDNKLTQL